MTVSKYQRLKQHALKDYPSLIWNEEQGDDDDSYTVFDPDGTKPTSVNIKYVNPKHMPFAQSMHELGHYLSILAGYHTPELEAIGEHFYTLTDLGFMVNSPEVLEEEERAWKMGQEFAAKYGLTLTAKDLQLKKVALNSYRRGMGLPTQ